MLHLGDRMSGAQFDDSRTLRYALWRAWSEDEGMCMWIGLNPSTADDKRDDPTIRKCVGFAKRWGFSGIYMLNLYSHISTDPRFLQTGREPMEGNDLFQQYAKCAGRIVCAWGAHRHARKGLERIEFLLPSSCNLWCLGVTQNGEPKHPLYVPYAKEPEFFATAR